MRTCSAVALLCCLLAGLGASEEFTLSVSGRKAMMGNGYVLMVTNSAKSSVRVLVTALNKKLEGVVDGKKTWELGHMEGFPFADKDTVKVTIGAITRTYQFAGGPVVRVFETPDEKRSYVVDFLQKQVFPAQIQLQAGGKSDQDQDSIGEYGTLDALAHAKVLDAAALAVVTQVGYDVVSLLPMTGTTWAVMPSQGKFDSDGINNRERYWLVAAVPKDAALPTLLIAHDGQVRSQVLGGKELLSAIPFKEGEPDLSGWQMLAK